MKTKHILAVFLIGMILVTGCHERKQVCIPRDNIGDNELVKCEVVKQEGTPNQMLWLDCEDDSFDSANIGQYGKGAYYADSVIVDCGE